VTPATSTSSAERYLEADQPDDHGLTRDAALRVASQRAADRERVVARLGHERAARIDKRMRIAERRAFDRDVLLDEVEGEAA